MIKILSYKDKPTIMNAKIKTSWPKLLTLVIASTLIAELFSGSTPFSRIVQLLPQFLLYGTGAVLIREVTRRLGLGWTTIILLGFAFGLVVEGLVLQSIFNPHFLGLDIAYGRAAGINWVWGEYLPGLHCFWSITCAILLCETIYPEDRHIPWVGNTGLWTCGIIFLLVCIGFHFLFIKIFKFRGAPSLFLYCLLLVIAVIVLALNLPRRSVVINKPGPKPAWSFWIITGVTFAAGALWFLGIYMIFMPGKLSLWISLPAGLLNILIYFTLLNNRKLMAIRSNKDRLGLATGLIGADLFLGYTGTLANKLDHFGQIFLIILTVTLLFVLYKRLGKQELAAKT
jgi:hypothetical protein